MDEEQHVPEGELWFIPARGDLDRVRALVATAGLAVKMRLVPARDFVRRLTAAHPDQPLRPSRIVPALVIRPPKCAVGAAAADTDAVVVLGTSVIFRFLGAACARWGDTGPQRWLTDMVESECEALRADLYAQSFYRDNTASEAQRVKLATSWLRREAAGPLRALADLAEGHGRWPPPPPPMATSDAHGFVFGGAQPTCADLAIACLVHDLLVLDLHPSWLDVAAAGAIPAPLLRHYRATARVPALSALFDEALLGGSGDVGGTGGEAGDADTA